MRDDDGCADPTNLPLFLPKFRVEECLSAIGECLERGWTGSGYKTIEFETAWKAYTGFRNAHFLNSSTAGLHLALHVLRHGGAWRDGDEVITTPLTFVSTNHAILYERLAPVFADVDDTLCLDPEQIAARISPRTRAVMYVGMGGNAGRYEAVLELCRERGLKLILDAAHMAGTRLDARHAGIDADAAVFSFHSVKNLPTGDSGMICFRDPAHDALARRVAWLGIDKDTYSRVSESGGYTWMYDVDHVGFKYHGNSIMAAIALVQLKYLDAENALRRKLAAGYRERFGGHPALSMIPLDARCASASHLFQIRARNRDALIGILGAHRIGAGVHYRDNTEYPMYRFAHGSCPAAARASAELLSLPMHIAMRSGDLDRVAELVIRHAA